MHTTRSPWWGLLVLCLPMLIVSMDVSVLFFAVPDIAADLHPSPAQQLWIFDVYGLVLAGLLLTMGAVADRVGHRRVLLIGAATFSAASVLAAFSTSAEMLIGARAVLAVAGATLMPSTLALIRHMFTDDAARAKAIGAWSAVMAGGVAVGPIVSGALLEHFWWGSVFLINVPVMIALLVAAPALLPGGTGDRTRRIDVVSAALALGAVLPTVGAIKAMGTDGLTPTALAVLTAGVALGVVFVQRQVSLTHPLMDLRLFSDSRLAVSVAVNLVAMVGIVGNAILVTQYLQSVLGYDPLAAALWSLAPTVVVAAVAPMSTTLAARWGGPAVMAAGLVVAAGGFASTWAAGVSSLWPMLAASTLIAGGLVAVATVVADHVVGVAPTGRAGAAAGMLETSSELGGGIGIAVLGSVLTAVYRASVDTSVPGVSGPAAVGLGGAVAAASRLGGDAGRAVLDAARVAYVDGLHVAATCAAALLLVTALLTLAVRERTSEPVDSRP
ncbi:MFS transporter [Williamsia serinedens]|uniref:MFS transporter, DHA2 family, multidrug resistance protein n=1 Tax=Williamsia serinedens TaxID=391736 RepID=A0ABT1GZM1_9NOCA|nr:MFS transporter [Williamsia serinedens]MCP2159708.1 MFS transporter, DHA2 family, multidrug resistance protein [Williamsia serinedens]